VMEKKGQVVSLGPSDLEAAKAEIRRLQRELTAAEEEREILKKQSTFSPGEAHEICLYCNSRRSI
jgi:transposase-like protein